MALKWLTAEEMVAISAAWVTAGEQSRAAIEKVPLLAALLPSFEKGHGDLVQLRAKEGPKLRALSQKRAELDAKHDALVRGIVGTLTMLAPVSDDREELLAIRDRLFPDGLGHTKLSYRGEAGHAAVVAKSIDEPMRARLKAIVVHKKTLEELVMAWLATASQLGQLEEEKARLSEVSPSIGAETQAARTAWIRLAKALMSNAKLAGLDDVTDQLLFSPLRKAERVSEGRAHGKTLVTPPVTSPVTPPAPAA
jgi:hypothetical protein